MFLLKISTRTFQIPVTKNHLALPSAVVSSLSPTTTTNSARTESCRRRRRRHLSAGRNDNNSGLEWERFDFSDSPKWDHRFKGEEGMEILEGTVGSSGTTTTATTSAPVSKRAQKRKRKLDGGIPNDLIHVASNSEDWESVHERETLEDEKLHDEFQRRHRAWDDLDPALIEQATEVLRPYLKPERQQRIHDVLDQRTKQTRFLFENPAVSVWKKPCAFFFIFYYQDFLCSRCQCTFTGLNFWGWGTTKEPVQRMGVFKNARFVRYSACRCCHSVRKIQR